MVTREERLRAWIRASARKWRRAKDGAEKLCRERTRMKTMPGLQWGDTVHVDGEMVQMSSAADGMGLT